MTEQLTIALAQLNPTMGDLDGNSKKALVARDQAAASLSWLSGSRST